MVNDIQEIQSTVNFSITGVAVRDQDDEVIEGLTLAADGTEVQESDEYTVGRPMQDGNFMPLAKYTDLATARKNLAREAKREAEPEKLRIITRHSIEVTGPWVEV